MTDPGLDLKLDHRPRPPLRTDYRIGIVGAGFVVREVHLPAYRNAGYHVAAIASRTPEVAHAVADLHGIVRVYDTPAELFADPNIEILDVAVPPDQQHGVIVDAALHAGHLRGILAHKPLGMNHAQACEIVALCAGKGICLAVNQNMRFDQSIRALKSLLERGYLGIPVFASIEMRAIPHWQEWLRGYDRLTLLHMSIHHLDAFRFLFGDPESVYASVRTDPRTPFPHRDGICLYILEYAGGLRAAAWDDIWVEPGWRNDEVDAHIRWRVTGTEGMAQGAIGWPEFPNRRPSTLEFTTARQPGCRFTPRWREVWFPDAFQGTMGALMDAIAREREPENSGRDNLQTMALVEACYRSFEQHRPVALAEISGRGQREHA